MRISVKVLARASKEEVVKNPDGSLKVYLKEAPADGKANRSLIELLSDYFGVSKTDIRIVVGGKSRKKIVELRNKF